MANQWYYAHNGVRSGPFSAEQMKALAASGDVLTTDVVWKNDMVQGVLARKVDRLFVTEIAGPSPESATVLVVAPPPLPLPDAAREAPIEPPSVAIPDELMLRPEELAPPAPVVSQPAPARMRRATASSGAVVVGQDGKYVRFRKKCTTCGHEDTSCATLAIMPGMMKSSFFCRKCKKNREVTLRGTMD